MAAYKDEIRQWLLRGIQKKATHVIVVCDTFKNDDYPVYVMPVEDAREVADQYMGKNMQRVQEVYNLGYDIEVQLAMDRCFMYSIPDVAELEKNPAHHPPTEAELKEIGANTKDYATRMVLLELQTGTITLDQCMKELTQINEHYK